MAAALAAGSPTAALGSGKLDWMNGTAHARRAALRQAHRQTTLITQGGDPRMYQHWLDRLAVPTARGTVTVQPSGSAHNTLGQTDGVARYALSLGNASGPSEFAHEMGHAFDDSVLTDADRARIMAIMHIKNQPWGAEGAAQSGQPNPPREKFAEIYRILATHPKQLRTPASYYDYTTRIRSLGYLKQAPGYFQMRKIERVLQDAANR